MPSPKVDAPFKRFRVIPIEDGQTLQQLVSRRMVSVPGMNRKRAASIIRAGGVYVNKLRIRVPMVRVAPGERITVYPEADQVPQLDPAALVFVHRDPNFVVLDKPAGVPVAQTRDSAQGTLAEALRRRLEQEGAQRPYVGLVHRLDRGASGLVLFTIRDVANKSLHKQFRDHQIARGYQLEVHGSAQGEFTVDVPLKLGADTVRVAQAGDPKAAQARTHFSCVASYSAPISGDARSLLRAELETGRTHQIRVHAAHSGLPIVGDVRYGRDAPEGQQERSTLRLHAQHLRFDHPLNGDKLELSASVPDWASAHAAAKP